MTTSGIAKLAAMATAASALFQTSVLASKTLRRGAGC
jgi:hypothetical protein